MSVENQVSSVSAENQVPSVSVENQVSSVSAENQVQPVSAENQVSSVSAKKKVSSVSAKKKVSSSVITVKRFSNLGLSVPCKVEQLSLVQGNIYSAKIVDDSHYVPNSNYLRAQLSSGRAFSKGSYDFPDGKDNGFNPATRDMSLDIAEIDAAAESVIDEANAKLQDSLSKEKSKKESERNEKIMDNLANMSNSLSESVSQQES